MSVVAQTYRPELAVGGALVVIEVSERGHIAGCTAKQVFRRLSPNKFLCRE